jgi:hypothetical protein
MFLCVTPDNPNAAPPIVAQWAPFMCLFDERLDV